MLNKGSNISSSNSFSILYTELFLLWSWSCNPFPRIFVSLYSASNVFDYGDGRTTTSAPSIVLCCHLLSHQFCLEKYVRGRNAYVRILNPWGVQTKMFKNWRLDTSDQFNGYSPPLPEFNQVICNFNWVSFKKKSRPKYPLLKFSQIFNCLVSKFQKETYLPWHLL